MNILFWVIQAVLAFLFVSGGGFKLLKADELLKMPVNRVLSAGGWRALGVVEMVGAVLLIVPGATGWMPVLTPLAATILAVECLALAAYYARFSRQFTAANPLVWTAAQGLLALVVAFGRYTV